MTFRYSLQVYSIKIAYDLQYANFTTILLTLSNNYNTYGCGNTVSYLHNKNVNIKVVHSKINEKHTLPTQFQLYQRLTASLSICPAEK